MAIQTTGKAFPTAEGFGKIATGGSGGVIYKVTNLNDSGAGSLREACEAVGTRNIVFTLGGRINLSSTINITNGDLTIFGQTAPIDSGGITLSLEGTPNQSVMKISASNVIVRYITVRRSLLQVTETNSDGLYITQGDKIILDHCSTSWASDENLPITEYDAVTTQNITIQNCIIAAPYGGSSKGSLCAHPNNLSFYRNLFVHNNTRNPQIATNAPEAPNRDGYYEVINNIIYGYKYGTIFRDNDNVTTPKGTMKLNYIKNKGFNPTGVGNNRRLLLCDSTEPVEIYVLGNIDPNRTSDAMDEWEITQGVNGLADIDTLGNLAFQVLTPVSTQIVNDGITLYDANDIWTNIKSDVGNSYPTRDSFDTLMVDDLDNLTDSHNALDNTSLGYPTLATGTAITDTNNDGIPDTWESVNMGGAVHSDLAPSGYTWLEEYVNQLTSSVVGNIPVITLTGASTINLDVDDVYSELGATANDTEDGVVSPVLITGWDEDTSIAGTFYKYYNIQDSNNNNAIQVVRTIIVSAVSGNIIHPLTNSQKIRGKKSKVKLVKIN